MTGYFFAVIMTIEILRKEVFRMLTSTELFKAITGDAEKLKNMVNKTIKVEEVETVETDKKIAVLKTTDNKLLISSSRNVVQVIPLLKNMVELKPVELLVTATDIGNGKSTISVKLKG